MRTALVSTSAVVLLLVGGIAGPAAADEPDSTSPDASYLAEVEAIAGDPVPYTSVDPSAVESDAWTYPDPANTTSSRAATVNATVSETAAASGEQLDPRECTLYPSVVHLRQSGNYETAGAKPYTKCLAGAPTNIKQTSTLYIVEWAGLVYKTMASATSQNFGQISLTQTNVAYNCANAHNSNFAQKTDGTSLQNGTTYYSTVWTSQVSLTCGY